MSEEEDVYGEVIVVATEEVRQNRDYVAMLTLCLMKMSLGLGQTYNVDGPNGTTDHIWTFFPRDDEQYQIAIAFQGMCRYMTWLSRTRHELDEKLGEVGSEVREQARGMAKAYIDKTMRDEIRDSARKGNN